MRYICIRQQDEMDCGAACLASVAGYYGLKMPVARLRRLAGTDREGTSIYGLVKTAEKLGFTAKGMKGDPEALLSGIPLPAIAHVRCFAADTAPLTAVAVRKHAKIPG